MSDRELMREHLAGHHAVIRHQGCPACLEADRTAPAGLRPRRVPPEHLRPLIAGEPPHRNGEQP